MKARPIALVTSALAILVLIVAWVLNAPAVNAWLGVHLGITDMTSTYYAFWSGFGSDLAELGIVGAAVTGVYQLNRKYNCHEHGCWRIGTHPAAGGQFLLCYRHHPDFQGKKPTHELIVELHRRHLEHEKALHDRLMETHQHGSEKHHHDPSEKHHQAAPAAEANT